MSEETKEATSYIIEESDAEAPPVSKEFEDQLMVWTQQGHTVSRASGRMVTRVFVEDNDGNWTHIYDENGNWIRSTTR